MQVCGATQVTARSGWLVLGLSLAAGATATLMASTWFSGRTADSMRPVVVAKRDIAAGQVLEAAMLERVSWPVHAHPPGAVEDPGVLSGRVSRTAMVRGEPVLNAKLAPEGSRGGLAAVIAPGHRAITVRVNEVMGVAGFALPGNFVDVLVTAQDESELGRMMSRIVLERILVLAVAQEASRDETRPKVVSAVTLEVTPHQAERIDLARHVGQLSLALRNQGDAESQASTGVSRSELLGVGRIRTETRNEKGPSASASVLSRPNVTVERQLRSPPPDAPDFQVEVIRGVLKSNATFNPSEVLRDR